MESVDLLKIVVAINASTLIAIVTYGYRVVRFFNRIEFKTDIMWDDFQSRTQGNHHIHRRHTDSNENNDNDESNGDD